MFQVFCLFSLSVLFDKTILFSDLIPESNDSSSRKMMMHQCDFHVISSEVHLETGKIATALRDGEQAVQCAGKLASMHHEACKNKTLEFLHHPSVDESSGNDLDLTFDDNTSACVRERLIRAHLVVAKALVLSGDALGALGWALPTVKLLRPSSGYDGGCVDSRDDQRAVGDGLRCWASRPAGQEMVGDVTDPFASAAGAGAAGRVIRDKNARVVLLHLAFILRKLGRFGDAFRCARVSYI